MTDSVQTENYDWGFKFTNLYGIDYRYTTAKGYFSDQLLKHNNLYGYDPLQMYVDLYVPWVRQGMIIRVGSYISPIDIETQLSPENYLYTHSVMYTYDPYTFTGIQFITKVNKNLHLILGVHAGNDMAPWTTSSQPNGEILFKWVSDSGNNSLFGGLDSIGHGYYKNGHDDLQVLALTWGPQVQRQVSHDHRVVLHLGTKRLIGRHGHQWCAAVFLSIHRTRNVSPGPFRLVRLRQLHRIPDIGQILPRVPQRRPQ